MNEDKSCGTCGRVYHGERDYLSATTRWRRCSQENLWFNCSCGSTLLIKKGKYDWYSPERFLTTDARGVFNRLGGMKDLPHIPYTVMEIVQLLQDPDASPKDVAKLVLHEPVVATQILVIAENIRIGRNPMTPKIHSLEHAIVYIGFKALSDLVMTSALKSLPLPKSDFRAQEYWNESFLCGTLAEFILRKFSFPLHPDEAFLAACLCNVGKLAEAFCEPQEVSKVESAVASTRHPVNWRQAEQQLNVPDHCIMGEIAASMWGFPVYMMQAARKHHELPVGKPGQPLDGAELAAVANQMTHWVLLRPHRMEYEIINAFARRFHLTEKDVDHLALELTALKDLTFSDSARPH